MKPFFNKTIFALALFCGLSAGIANAQSGVCAFYHFSAERSDSATQ